MIVRLMHRIRIGFLRLTIRILNNVCIETVEFTLLHAQTFQFITVCAKRTERSGELLTFCTCLCFQNSRGAVIQLSQLRQLIQKVRD